jgi:hypothetical protein
MILPDQYRDSVRVMSLIDVDSILASEKIKDFDVEKKWMSMSGTSHLR